jgi:hypothetical protein
MSTGLPVDRRHPPHSIPPRSSGHRIGPGAGTRWSRPPSAGSAVVRGRAGTRNIEYNILDPEAGGIHSTYADVTVPLLGKMVRDGSPRRRERRPRGLLLRPRFLQAGALRRFSLLGPLGFGADGRSFSAALQDHRWGEPTIAPELRRREAALLLSYRPVERRYSGRSDGVDRPDVPRLVVRSLPPPIPGR